MKNKTYSCIYKKIAVLIFISAFISVSYSQKIEIKKISEENELFKSPSSIELTDYYQNAYKLSGIPLRAALQNIIKGHTVISYDALYNAYIYTDSKPNGKVWDMYSDIPGGTSAYEYTHITNKCGNYSQEGDCYNREHSWPQSWFNETNPARTDIFHIYPTDGYVNGKRGNYPFGEVSSPNWTSTNGSKVGSCSFPGYSSTVFEPIDAYKGDLARSSMYMSVRYYTQDGGWSSSGGTNKSDLLPWYANLLYSWHIKDSVSTKESNRNNVIYNNYQHNRNPFIDHPEFAAEIWQTGMKPEIKKVLPAQNQVLLDLSRYIDSSSAVNILNFLCDKNIGNPLSVQWGVDNDVSKLLLTFASIGTGTLYSLDVKNLKSINNVVMNDTVVTFFIEGPSGINEEKDFKKSFRLNQNYPNPFNPSTEITFEVFESGKLDFRVFDILGREVASAVEMEIETGLHRITFNAVDLTGGVYFYRVSLNKGVQTGKMMLLK